ncbi:MAG: hypothetical protein HYX29_10240 [Solirubrobacterales bacterium]|nr:hypothetical protein [Solirubrobacterales bacterium]
MNRPKATRLRLCLAIAAIAAFAVILPATASADIANSGPTPATGSVVFADPTPGAHSDITITQNYAGTYSGVPSGAPGTTGDDLKQWMLDTPAGFYGNPNAVPYDDRCTIAQSNNYVNGGVEPGTPVFNPSSPCPTTAQVGTATLTLGIDANGATGAVLSGKIYIVQSAVGIQDVPTTLFTVFTSTIQSGPAAGNQAVASTSRTQIAPVTSGPEGDYRLRSVSEGPINRPDLSAALGQAPGTTYGHIKQIVFNLKGILTNGNAFQTNPSRCGNWKSTLYASSYGTPGGTANQTTTVSGTAANGGDSNAGPYLAIDAGTVNVSCALPRPALTQTASASLTSNARGANPGLNVSINNPDADNRDRAAKLVTKLPASVSVNVNALNNVCSEAAVVADTCPAASQIGTATIKAPMLTLPQTGRVYMTKGATAGLPYLSIWVDGAIKFRLDATTRFVGASFNEIETTFDNLPQLAFEKFDVNITGGSSASSLLATRSCPLDGTSPDNGPITFSTTGWGGTTVTASSSTSLEPCFGVAKPSKIQNCVKQGKLLQVTPKGIISKAEVAKVTLLTGTKKTNVRNRATDRKLPFKFKLSMKKSKYKKNKSYYYAYKVYYKDGNTVKTKTNTFRVCK